MHKIVAFYLALGNLQCYARTNVDNLQLVLWCREVDLNHFGQDKVLSQLIAYLKDLELSDVQIGDTTYRARIMCMLVDNLGSHWVGGFSTNFSNHSYVCRYCLINVKNDVYKNGYRRRDCTAKTAKIQRFVRFLMYCSISTVPVAFY